VQIGGGAALGAKTPKNVKSPPNIEKNNKKTFKIQIRIAQIYLCLLVFYLRHKNKTILSKTGFFGLFLKAY